MKRFISRKIGPKAKLPSAKARVKKVQQAAQSQSQISNLPKRISTGMPE